MNETRICAFCGQEFIATNGMQKFCKRVHYDTCVICGMQFEVPAARLVEKDRARCCSRKCNNVLRKQTNLVKYGGAAPVSSADVRAKIEATNLERYGVKHAAQSEAIKSKIHQTVKDRYGVDWYAQTEDWKIKSIETSKQHFGVAWPTTSEVVRSKTVQTNLDRYGTENPMQSNEAKTSFIHSHMQDGSKLELFLQYKEDPRKFVADLKLDHKPTLYELSAILGVNTSTVGVYLYKYDCKDIVDYDVSVMEQEVTQTILSIVPDAKIEFNIRNVITPYELDIYLPEYKLAIECNPTATHNSTVNVFDDSPSSIFPGYHLMKTKKCEEVGIFLLHIFSFEWLHNKDVIISMLRNLLSRCEIRIFARKCEVKLVDGTTAAKFLSANHRQGNANSPVRIGLYYQGGLVSLMTFGKMRNTIGTSTKEALENCWELVRFCSKLNTNVVGGASKLFKYFVNTFQPMQVRSFSDRAHTRGKLYSILGFKQIRTSSPGYTWVNLTTDISYNRCCAQKHNIITFLDDPTIDLSKTERQIMIEHNFVQVYDCGTILWEWLK